jgi:predicted acylesterase/phospholipase RssA
MPKTFRDKLAPAPQKKLLACDGGGIRGILSLEVLAGIESMLRQKTGDPNLVLSDFFDYVAGTSTGAIIATCISRGMAVADIKKFYLDSGPAMFDKAGLLERIRSKYKDEALAQKLRDVLGSENVKGQARPVTLGSDTLRTLLLVVMRNATTDSPWPISNNPAAKYNDATLKDCNLEIPLWQLVRASTAAPTYFPPEMVEIGDNRFIFVDGGVTMYNNPAFQMFLMATVEPYKLQWATGTDKMLVVSVGTGTSPQANANLQSSEMNILYNAGSIPSALMFAALNEQDFLCRVFGDCLAGTALDLEIGDMIGKRGPVAPKLFTYMRYNAELTVKGLAELGLPNIKPEHVQAMDSVQYVGELSQVGQAVAKQQVKAEHFSKFIPQAAKVGV